MTIKNLLGLALIGLSLSSCNGQAKADLLLFNARIYTVDSNFTITESMVISDGKIVETGKTEDLRKKYKTDKELDAGGQYVYPGLIDAHAHFYRYGLGLQTADLVGTASWEEIIERLLSFGKDNPDGWLTGRGWDQNDWAVKNFPTKEKLDQLFPARPVLLTRIDGHAAIANQKALDLAGIRPGMTITGGTVETIDGKLTGILIDNAIDLVSSRLPLPTPAQAARALEQGQQRCFAVGLTTVDDCGIDYREALFIDSLQKAGSLKMRIYAMLSDAPQNFDYLFKNGKIKTDRLNIRSFKVYADGALGSRGACLLEPYADRPGWKGFLLSSLSHFDSVAAAIAAKDMQMCTHAIGDSGNRAVLNIYAKHLGGKNDRRWRIEHAQVVNSSDFHLFGAYSIIPSVQPTHATSDMYWAEARLGPVRVKGAYAYKQLMEQNGWVPLGTDFPVEDISPFKTFYASVFRTDAASFPAGGFQPENALSREQALRGMTIW
ncbi:MAG TPA: amidohydrolase, partial [Flavisolibacter sp.]|nr:amidohydrolase [Flavisolibacter sp.]